MSGKVVVITGASSGIGEAAARLLAKDGARLVLGARRTDRLTGLANEIVAAGGEALAVMLDVTARDSMDDFVGRAIERFGRIDVFVHNAGLMMLGPWAELRRDEWDRMFDVNVRGVLNGIASALPHMLDQQSGHMILIGSTAGHHVVPLGGAYSATKFALRAIADSLRAEGGTAIRATLISPSATRTEIVENVDHPIMREALLSRRDLMLSADDVARAIAYAIAQPAHVDVSEIIVRPTSLKD
ncbi:SDR family oxidoreductase [Novosphingobium sp. G106]|uniref:SDR family oxidoreductase n=1 Tax=Novosphingobium sp. G106 TaxID=2849500 RepID=UPI001C2D29D1|nr:SDR family oxidoreductase [Novosphingobium sp. G106]MBV1691655.1 SDR family oxidoreductase [Novosphingobium sp. G106]